MKAVRRITRNGHSNTVSIPAAMLDYLRLVGGDNVIVEVTERLTLEIRRLVPADLENASVSAMRLPDSTVASR